MEISLAGSKDLQSGAIEEDKGCYSIQLIEGALLTSFYSTHSLIELIIGCISRQIE